MAAPTPAAGFASKNRVAILAELDKEKRKLILQNQSSTNNPGASIALARPNVNKDFRDHAEQQHIAAQQKAALQPTKFKGNLSLDSCCQNQRQQDSNNGKQIRRIGAAYTHAHAHSTGYFITQDSAFGNLILPVIPRLEAE
ncbi:SOSS complex subunit C isoform X1 [Ranitomeya imitator]|uniref:SOSS complex subunit C isoform X1 n=1 Tax=Ranitomeya imitator TaxID=111125 RepID=UPI0037E92EF6